MLTQKIALKEQRCRIMKFIILPSHSILDWYAHDAMMRKRKAWNSVAESLFSVPKKIQKFAYQVHHRWCFLSIATAEGIRTLRNTEWDEDRRLKEMLCKKNGRNGGGTQFSVQISSRPVPTGLGKPPKLWSNKGNPPQMTLIHV